MDGQTTHGVDRECAEGGDLRSRNGPDAPQSSTSATASLREVSGGNGKCPAVSFIGECLAAASYSGVDRLVQRGTAP